MTLVTELEHFQGMRFSARNTDPSDRSSRRTAADQESGYEGGSRKRVRGEPSPVVLFGCGEWFLRATGVVKAPGEQSICGDLSRN